MSSLLKSVFTFDKFITPKIITVIYILLIIAQVIAGVAFMFSDRYRGFTITNFFIGLVVIILGILFIRIFCEVSLIFFRINENLKVIRDKQS